MIRLPRLPASGLLEPGLAAVMALVLAGAALPPAPMRNSERAAAGIGVSAVPLPERKPGAGATQPGVAQAASSAMSPTKGVPLPERKPLPSQLHGTEDPSAPQTAQPPPVKPATWSEPEVAAAMAECHRLLDGLPVRFSFVAPIRQGACGTAQPIELKAFGRDPEVTIDPPATVNCRLAAALVKWFGEAVQPLARKHLNAPVTHIVNATSYACRNRYNSPKEKLSEHARANALDISTFDAGPDHSFTVEAFWGQTARGMLAEQKAKAAGAKFAGAQPAGTNSPAAADTQATAHAQTAPSPEPEAGWTAEAQPAEPPASAKQVPAPASGLATVKLTFDQPAPSSPEGRFLHAVHHSACDYFGTVLGPEANVAHKDHFHVDLAPRDKTAFCQ